MIPRFPADLGVIIPTRNEASAAAAAVHSAAGAGQILVVDGGSNDSTCEIAAAAGAEVLQCPPGRGRQLALGCSRCRLPGLLVLHADCRLTPGALSAVCDALAGGGSGWGAMRQQIDAEGIRFRLLERGNSLRVRFRGVAFGDQAMFFRRDWYLRAGGFESIPLMEDLRLSHRLRALGPPRLVNDAVVVSARRWHQRGVVRQTLLNLSLQTAHAAGVGPERLAKFYR